MCQGAKSEGEIKNQMKRKCLRGRVSTAASLVSSGK